jgi:hypothetical protein
VQHCVSPKSTELTLQHPCCGWVRRPLSGSMSSRRLRSCTPAQPSDRGDCRRAKAAHSTWGVSIRPDPVPLRGRPVSRDKPAAGLPAPARHPARLTDTWQFRSRSSAEPGAAPCHPIGVNRSTSGRRCRDAANTRDKVAGILASSWLRKREWVFRRYPG